MHFQRFCDKNLNNQDQSDTCTMNLFFSPPVRSYAALIPHYEACQKVDTLIATGYIEFQLNPCNDSKDAYYLIYSRIRSLKHRLQIMISDIEGKYHQQMRCLSNQEKIITVAKMKDLMKEKHMDHLKYLDIEESQIEFKLARFSELSKSYDSIDGIVRKYDEEIDTLRAKLQVCNNQSYTSEEFTLIHGICRNTDMVMIERLLFRKSRGHSYVVFKNRPVQSDSSIFLCFMNKNIYKHIGEKILAVCAINEIRLYELPNRQTHLRTYQDTLIQKRMQVQGVLQLSGVELTRVLRESMTGEDDSLKHHLTRISYLERIVYIICHSKQVGEPANHVLLTMHAPLSEEIPNLGVPIIPTNRYKPRTIVPRLPCLFEANHLTELFSIPKHNEILPSVFMFITVPILFGMMFSDMGHGLMLLVICCFLKVGPMFYIMAFMSIYCGFIYNEFFGMKIVRIANLGIVQAQWGISQNGLNFQNSLKMKISMIIAFVHMFFGGMLKIINELKRKQRNLIIYDSIPKVGLLITTVGYMDFLIISKWLTNFKGREYQAPSIINCLLELYLGWNQSRKHSIFSSIETEKTVGSFIIFFNLLFLGIMFYNQTIRKRVQEIYFKFSKGKLRSKKDYRKVGNDSDFQHRQLVEDDDDLIDQQISEELQQTALSNSKSLQEEIESYYIEADEHESELGPLQIFEYVLSLISSTTSYLRLFALSLAHAKLSHLLLGFLLGSLTDYNPSISIIRCTVFFMSTCTLMLALDVMECMMHVVRLHWVEWMGKFYTGNGVLFKPEIQENYQ